MRPRNRVITCSEKKRILVTFSGLYSNFTRKNHQGDFKMNKELWKTVDAKFEISNCGRVKKNGQILELKQKGCYQYICTNGKFLGIHCLVYSMFAGDTIDTSKFVIHHKDENPYNNRLDNLQKMTKFDHKRLHNTGNKNPMYGTHRSVETREKIRQALLGKKYKKGIKLYDNCRFH